MATTLNNVRFERGFCLHVTHDTCDCTRAKTLLFQVIPNMSTFTLTPFTFTIHIISNSWATSIHILIEGFDNRIFREGSLSASPDTLFTFTILLFLLKIFSNLFALSTKYSDRVVRIRLIVFRNLILWNFLDISHSRLIIGNLVNITDFSICHLLWVQGIGISSCHSKNVVIILTTTETPFTFSLSWRLTIVDSILRMVLVTSIMTRPIHVIMVILKVDGCA